MRRSWSSRRSGLSTPRSTRWRRPASLEAALAAAEFDPAELERIEERLFALRAASRKYASPVDGLAALAEKYAAEVAADRCRRGATWPFWKKQAAGAR